MISSLFCLKEEEVSMLTELSHLQEVMDKLDSHASDPFSLPPASEQVLTINIVMISTNEFKIDNFSYIFDELTSPP